MESEIKSPVKAIRAKCLDCCYDSPSEVRMCPSEDCPLYPFRFGKNPYIAKRDYTEEEKEAMKERLAAAREKRNDERKNEQ